MIVFPGGFEVCLVFYCWVTNYHKLSGLKQQFLLTHSFCSWEIQKDSTGSLLSSHNGQRQEVKTKVSHRVKDKMLSIFLSGGSGEEFYSNLIQVDGRIQFLVTVGLKSLFPFWLLARNCFQILYVTWIPWHVPVHLQAHSSKDSLSCTLNLSDVICQQWENSLLLKTCVIRLAPPE